MIERILTFPVRFLRLVWSFINPSRQAGRIALGRLAITVQVLVALAFVGYTLAKKSIRLPFSGEPYQVQILMTDAQGLDRLDEPAAAVAGTPLGSVTDVEIQSGKALVTLTFENEVRGKLFADASASVRPASALQNLLVNVDPGTPEAGLLPEGQVIQPSNARGYVTIDQLTSILDADTQAYVSIVLEQADIAVRDRENEFRHALAEVGDLVELATPLSRTLARRRELLTRLVGELEVVAQTLGDRGAQLAQGIDAGSRTLAITAAREGELAAVTRELGPLLEEATVALRGARELTVPLLPALSLLTPTAAPLAEALADMRALLPRAESLTNQFEALVRDGAHPLELMLRGTRGIRARAQSMVPVMRALTELTRRLDRVKGGMGQTADTLSAAFSYQDNVGPYAPIQIVQTEPARPENFGMGGETSASQRNRLERRLAAALEATCLTENPLACLFRFNIPGLPKRPVLRDARVRGGGS